MTDKYIYYDYDGRNLKVPVGEQSEFESRVPDAKMMLTYEGKNYKVPLSELSNFTDRVGKDNLTYSAFDDNREYAPKLSVDSFMSYSAPNTDIEEQDEYDRPGLGETVLKGIGSAGVGTAKTALDLGRMAFNTSVIGGIARAIAGRDLKEDILNESNPWTKASMRLGELQEELSREADPTGGQQGFVDLLSEGKVGMALQKALGSGIESLPMMLAASTGAGALVYGAGMAASTYSDETRENPDIPDWKRGINAIGSAALEMAVERIGGPLKNAFGKAGGELTEEMAKELLENVAKEGTESIAKRIAKGLLNVGKEGLEEGGEELLTSFGNDALGEALDLIDGDKDYGIRAQWEKAKEENPNISVGDFAKSKAKEYLDSFIGGALSGMQISGATGAINYVAKNEDLASREINKKRELGASLDYGNMYDVDDVVNETINNVEQSFVNKDGEPALSREFIASLSSDQAFELAKREDAPAEQRNAFYNLAKAKAAQEGLNSKLDQKLNEKIAADRAIIEGATENGKVLSADYGGKTVYVKGGVIKKSRITLPDGNHGPVIVIDSATGEQQTVNTKDLGALEYLEADKLITLNENTLREGENRLREQARTTMSPLAKAKAILPFAKKKILVDVGNGLTEVFVESISPTGEVMIKGKKGDLGGQSILTMNAATFYDSIYRDDNGNPVVTEVEQGAKEEVTDTPVVETTEDVDYGDYEGPILVGGRLVDVMETQQDKPSNTVNYTYVDENGDMRVGSMTIDEFGAAVKQAEEQTKNPVPAPETAPIESPEPVVNEPTPTPEPTPEPAPEEITEETDWDALFENDTVAFYDEVKKQFGDKAMDFLNMEIQATQNEISSLEKNMGKSTNERAKNFSKLASLRLKLGSLNEMSELLEKQSNPVAETPTEAPTEVSTEPVDETPTETTEETPTEPETEEQNPLDSQGNSVTLEDGENENNNGVRAEDETGGGEYGPSDNADGNESDGGGNQSESETDTEGGAILDSESGEENPVDKYPVRNGDVTQDMVKTAFGFSYVTNSLRSQKTLNTVYDTLMGMAKMLGISPKSIGHGGRLGLSRLGDRVDSSTWAWYERGRDWDGNVARTIVSIRDTHISSLLHEWWHSLDHALNYTNTGKGSFTTSVGKANFTGRQEVLNAVNAVMKAIKSSGHIGRIERAYYGPSHERYLKSKKEATARAFEEYILGKFAESGIAIEGIERENISSQPTAEEMKVIAPAFDKLFKVLKEKEGKAQGTTVLYHIGEQMAPQSDAKKLATEAVFMSLDEGGREIDILSDEQTEQYLKMIGADTETQFSVDTDKPIFLSNAAIAVSGIKQEKATPEQWLKMIEKAGGLKAGEDKWMGLSDWLKASDKKTLTKQEVLDFISENTIRIEEVNYGEIDYFSEDKKFIDAINNEFLELRREAEEAGEWIHDAGDIAYEQMVERYGDDFSIAFGVDLGELYVSNREAASVITGVDLGVEREINETRLGYTTDGLDNNKEIALIVPTIEPWNQHDEIHFGDAGDGRAVAWVRFGEARTYSKEYADFYDFQGKMQKKYFPDRVIQALGGSDLDALTEEERAEFERLREIAKSIPAKNRTNRKVLVIDEIQSKRHQEGREQGYSMTKEDYQKRLDSLETEAGDRLKRRTELLRTLKEKYGEDFRAYLKLENTAYVPNESVMSPEEVQEWNATSQEEINEAIDSLKKQKRAGVPDAPFDKNWHELAMKRMLRYAAENGYDAIAWTKGEQQADRYSLTKHFTTIEREDNPSINGRRFQFYGGNVETFIVDNSGVVTDSTISDAKGKPLADVVGKDLSVKMMSIEDGETLDNQAIAVGGEGMRGFYDKMLPSFMNKYGKKWGVKVSDITLPHVEKAGRIMHSVPVNEAMRESVIEGQPMFFKTPNGTVYGWTDGKKIYLTKAGINPNTPIHEYTHLWAKAMMLRNPKGWNSVKQLLKNTPVWNEVMNDANYSNIHSNEDLVASEALSRISGSENAAKLEQMAQQMIDEAKGTMRKAEARGLIQNIKDALNKFWNWVGTELFGIEKFESVEQVTDRVLWDLVNKTDLGELSEGQVETQIVTDPKVIAELEASPKRTGYRNVVQNEDGTFSSPMAYWLQSKNGGAKTRVETAKFELGKWEEAEEHPELVDEKGHVILVKPNKSTVEVAYDPYIHNRLDPVNLQFKDAWKRDELVYVETEVPETDLESGYHADEALLSVGVHSWSNGDLMLSKYDKPVRVMPLDDVADAWVERLNGEGVHFDVVPPSLRPLLVERGVEILPPHKGMGKDCIDAYDEWKNSNSENNSVSLPNVSQAIESGVWDNEALNELNNIVKDVEERKAILKRYTSSELTGLLEGGSLLVGASIISRGSEENGSQSGERVGSVEERAAETVPAITAWAKKIGIWREYSERSEEEISSSYIKSGGEAQVFSLGNGKFEKIISLKYFVDPQLAIDRIAIHNSLFEETLLTVTGFGTNRDGEFAIIVEQAAIDGKHTSNEEIDSYLDSIGFEKIDDASRTFANEELYLSDLHEENVLNQEHKRYYVIDGDFRLNTPEAGIGGTREVDDSIARTEDDGILSRSGDVTPEDIRNKKAAIKEKAVADGTFMKAPNGEPTNLTEDQWLTVRTESFKNWFGDWENDPKNASKVVDKNGEPQVVYHGSPYGAITEFDRRGHSVSGLREFGTYFSTSKELAQLYAYARQQARGDIEKYETEKYRLNAIIFNNETPARVALDAFDELDRLEESQKPKVYEVFLNIREPKVFDAERSNGWDGWHKLKQDVGYDIKSGVEAIEAIAGHNSAARMDKKYDGIIAQNMADVHSEATEDLMGDVFLVFDETPANIKSATSNIGTFDPEKNDIRYRRSTPVGFHQLEVDNFLSKYNPNCEVIVFPINERTAKAFGYTLKELKEKHGRYLPSYDFIAIFAREDLMDRSSIEDTLFHESIHKLAQSSGYEYMVEAGKWMWENASNNEVLSDYKEIIEEGYKNKSLARKHEEMLCYVLAGAMESGHVEWLLQNVSEDTASILNEILNEIGYESAAETRERRARESVSQSAVAKDISDAGSENAGQSSRRGYAGATGRPANAESERRVTVENQNASVNLHTGETRDGIIERAVSEEAQKLGVNVTFAKRSEMAKGHETDKGYYNTKTGEIVICPENNASIADTIQTILHEAVAHKGLRQLMGDKFDEFINRVYDSLDAKTKEKVDKLAKDHYKGNKAVAMEEYMATLAESEDFNDKTIWDKIVEIFEDIINKILDRDDFTIGDKELRYILRASYNNMANPRNMETVRGWAQEQMMREEYKINKATPELLSRTGIDPTQVSSETAKAVYDRVVSSQWQEFERQFQDAMQPVRIAIDAIQQETGNIPIEDYENYILIQNHASSRSRVEIDEFERRYFGPIVDKVNEVVTAYIKATGGSVDNEAQRAAVYKMIKNYLIAKHGLERNQYYQLTKKRKLTPYEKKKEIDKLTEEYETKVNYIRNDSTLNDTEKELEIHKEAEALRASIIEVNERLVPDLRDYSGLTTLFGFPPRQYKKAEEEAKKYVADIEKKLGRVDDEDGNVVTESPILTEMWDKIKSATDKTLRHSYECGLLSRGQYEEIKDMFTHYIPLRGYDETTAEDVYSYSRFEGNRFNPAVQTVKGRTSLAEDPLAIIMNMAESEIAQGNKNRAKQALYNYLLNRSAGNKDQNSLMQIESVWYLVNYDEAGKEYFTIAAPNHEAGETYEEFEARMIALEEEEKAFKSKKGKVNVGMRFQKQMDRNSHYVYLKVNGVEKAIYINGDPKAADAINGTYYPKSNAVVDKIKDVNRFISSTFTNYSLSFTARNFVRDAIYSRINMSIRESDPAYRKQFRKNYWHTFGNMRSLIKAYRNGELDGRDLNPEEAAFVEFMRNGGQTGYTVINSVENHKKELERAIKRMQRGTYNGGGKSGFIAMFKWIELMNESSELLTRFVAYKTSRDMGRGIETSIGNAKEITVNFNTRGAQDGTGILGGVANYFGWSKYFFNASVQGVQNLTAMAKANKIKFCETVGGIIGFGFAMPFIHALASLWGDDDENEYWNIPEYDRQNNICIQAFGTYIKIPLPIGFREMYAIGDTMAAALCDKKFTRDLGQIGKDMANKVASIVLPINPLESAANGLDLWQTGAYAILPSGLQFVMQNMTNIDWKGAPLQKEYTYNEHDPQWTKAFASNPKWMTGLSKWCNENINLDGDFDGMDWSPEKLDNTLSNVFGGMYSLVKQTGKSIYTMFSKDKDFNVMSVPLVGVVLSSGIDEDDRFITDAYYDMKEYYDENVNSIKRTAKAFGYDLKEVFSGENVGAHHPRMQRIYNNRNFDFMQEWYAGNKELESLKNKIEYREKKIAGMDEVPNELIEEIAALKNELENERREFVNDMLELD